MNLEQKIADLCGKAKAASYSLAQSPLSKRNNALGFLAEKLVSGDVMRRIIEANEIDLEAARGSISDVMLDRLRLDETRIKNIAAALVKIISLADPLGSGDVWTRPNGMVIRRVRVPLGVVGMIYESRPNVTVDSAALCIKSGNAVVLRGGKEALNSNAVLADLTKLALSEAGLDADCVQFIGDTSRESANILMRRRGKIDVLIPRGGASLIRSVAENASVPVIETGVGNCHIFADESADFEAAANVILKSKTRASVCNSVETILIAEKIHGDFLPVMKRRLDELNVEIRGCAKTCAVLGPAAAKMATEEDYCTEYNDYILSVKVVAGLDEAVAHINKYGTRHSEAILTRDIKNAREFQGRVDAAAVYANVSTRFTDGEEFGFGAEIGISTSMLHARGPVGLPELTTVKYLIDGDNLVR